MTNTDYRLTPDAVHGRVIAGAEQVRRARLRVATEATDADDCRLLLEALGILFDDHEDGSW